MVIQVARQEQKPAAAAAAPPADPVETSKTGGRREGKLTVRERAFVHAYLAGPSGVRSNATAAARMAGYSDAGGGVGSSLTSRPHIRAAIAAWLRKHEITTDRVLAELARIGFSDMRDFAAWGPDGVTLRASAERGDEAAPAVAEVTEHRTRTTTEKGAVVENRQLRFKLHNKVAALIALGRYLKLFPSIHGEGSTQPRVAVIMMNGIQEGKFREAAAKLAQKRLDELRAGDGGGPPQAWRAPEDDAPAPQPAGERRPQRVLVQRPRSYPRGATR